MKKINIELAEKVFVKVFDRENLTLSDLNDISIDEDFLFDYGLPIKESYLPFEYTRIMHWQNAVLRIGMLIYKHGAWCEFIEILEVGGRLYFNSNSIQNVPRKNVFPFFYADNNQSILVDDIFWINVNLADNYFDYSIIQDYLRLNDGSFGTKNMNPNPLPNPDFKTYIIFEENTGYYKIGKSKRPHIREKTLRSEKPNIKMILVCENNIESVLHKKYKRKRIRGEWFDLNSDEILDIIEKYNFTKVDF
jgi:hypothetical protein